MASLKSKGNFANRMQLFAPSHAVSEILGLAERPDVISLAGGLPDPSIFSLQAIRESMERVMNDEAETALNYGPNLGISSLREWVADRMQRLEDVRVQKSNILITSGGVDGLNLTSMALLNKSDVVLIEAPTYMVALHIFRTYEAQLVSVATDELGLNPDALEERLKDLKRSGISPKFLYVIPSFQNPSGRTTTIERRKKIAELCQTFGVPIVEDHAYAELAYDKSPIPSFKSIDTDNVIFVHTFSKIFGPGVRLGWVAGTASLVKRLGLCKLGTDQCANSLTQRLVFDFGSRGFMEKQVDFSIELYRKKRDSMIKAIAEHFPRDARYYKPAGGFFVWIELAENIDTELLLATSIEREKVAFVAGRPFFHDGKGGNHLRLSFSFPKQELIHEGVRRLGKALATASD